MAIKQVTLSGLKQYLRNAPITRRIDEVVGHHSWSPTTREYRGLPTWKGIDYYHGPGGRGWTKRGGVWIGYHFGIGADGSIWLLRGIEYPGCHVLNRNGHSIGFCMIGNFDHDDPTPILPVAAQVTRAVCDRFELGASAVRFHREFQDKTCPGTRINLSEFRHLVMGTVADADTGYPDVTPNVPTLAVVLGGQIIPCAPQLVGGRMTVDAQAFFFALGMTASVALPDFVHADTGRMFIHEAAPWFRERGWVIGGEVWRQEQAGGVTVKRLYPQRVEWMA